MHMKLLYELTNHSKDTPIEQVVDDFTRKYCKTYMRLNGKLEYILKVSSRGILQYYKDNKTAELQITDQTTLTPFLPKTGYYQTDNGLFFIQRKASRQWKKSYCQDIYEVEQYGKPQIPQIRDNYYPFSLDELDSDSPNIAINRLWAIVWKQKKTLLMYRDTAVGTINYMNKAIKLNFPEIEQEVRDMLNRQGLHSWTIMRTE